MSKSPSSTAIGAFVLGAIAIAVCAVIFFGSGALIKDRGHFVCFFDENVDGLQIGSKVNFKGVPIGTVTDILLRFETSPGAVGGSPPTRPGDAVPKPVVPVLFEIDMQRISRDLGVEFDFNDPEFYSRQAGAGLRGKLTNTSFITGLLQVSLDYFEDAPPPQIDDEFFEHDGEVYIVIPALKSDLAAIKEQFRRAITELSRIDFEKLTSDVASLASNLDAKVEELDVENINAAVASLKDAGNALKETASSEKLDEAFASIRDAGDDIGALADDLRGQVGDSAVQTTLDDLRASIRSIQGAAENISGMVGDESATRGELDRALTEVGDAATSIRELSDYLAENPSSIIFGRKDKKDENRRRGDDPPGANPNPATPNLTQPFRRRSR